MLSILHLQLYTFLKKFINIIFIFVKFQVRVFMAKPVFQFTPAYSGILNFRAFYSDRILITGPTYCIKCSYVLLLNTQNMFAARRKTKQKLINQSHFYQATRLIASCRWNLKYKNQNRIFIAMYMIYS